MAKQVRLLSIDGGGIRGLVPAVILAEIEKRTEKPIAQLFDFITGTSTGGLLALGLTKPGELGQPCYTAKDLVKLYENEGDDIFSCSIKHRVRAVVNLFEEKYTSHPLEKFLEKYFGETRLKEALADVFIPVYEIERRIPFFFESRKARQRARYDFQMKQVARAAVAAPTYFEPLKLETDELADYYALIDGGVFANNPAMCGYVEAKKVYGSESEVMIVSLGTGTHTKTIPYEEAAGWGLANWAQPLLDVVLDGQSDTVHHQMKALKGSGCGPKLYYRFQAILNQENDELDNACSENIRSLKLIAEDVIRENKDPLLELCEKLRAEPVC
jgi:patatin-like phospholipase/acyl hydrolase